MSDHIDYQAALEQIRLGRFKEALSLLQTITQRNSEHLLAWATTGHLLHELYGAKQSDVIYLRVRRYLRKLGGGLNDLGDLDLRSLELAVNRALAAEARIFNDLANEACKQLNADESKLVRIRKSISAMPNPAIHSSPSAIGGRFRSMWPRTTHH